MMLSSRVLHPGDVLSATELHAAHRDGLLRPLGAGYVPFDAADTPELRAATLGPVLTTGTALCHLSAAWVYGALDECPSPAHLTCAVPGRSANRPSRAGIVHHEHRVDDGDVNVLSGIPVTTPGRTLAELCRCALNRSRDESALLPVAARLSSVPGAVDAARAWFAAHPRRTSAARALAFLDAQELVTR